MAKKIELQFENEDGHAVTYSLDDPVEPADVTAINAAMDAILNANAFTSSGGDLVAKKGARIVDHNVTDIPLS